MGLVRVDHVGVVVRDIAAATAFFVALGFEPAVEAEVGGDWVDRIVGLRGVQATIAMLAAPDGSSRFELAAFASPESPPAEAPAPANAPGLRHVCLTIDDLEAAVARVQALGAELVGAVERYRDSYLLCYVRGPEGIIVELTQPLG